MALLNFWIRGEFLGDRRTSPAPSKIRGVGDLRRRRHPSAPPTHATMMLQSLADGSCLTDAPLRFEISCAAHWSNATATEIRLGKYHFLASTARSLGGGPAAVAARAEALRRPVVPAVRRPHARQPRHPAAVRPRLRATAAGDGPRRRRRSGRRGDDRRRRRLGALRRGAGRAAGRAAARARGARQKPARLPLLLAAQAAPPPPQAASRGPRRQLSLQVRARMSSGRASPAAAAPSDEERALRLELRQMRDELRPTRLVKRMSAGDDFVSVGADGRASLVRLALAADRDELVVTRAAAASSPPPRCRSTRCAASRTASAPSTRARRPSMLISSRRRGAASRCARRPTSPPTCTSATPTSRRWRGCSASRRSSTPSAASTAPSARARSFGSERG